MKKIALVLVAVLLPASILAGEGMISIESSHDVSTTADRLENILEQKGMTVFKRIDHSGGAAGVGIELRPTELLIFGNPKVGTPLMKCAQTAAIDLPQKALIWQDEAGRTFLSYNDPNYVRDRHSIGGCEAVLSKISKALDNFAKAATGQE